MLLINIKVLKPGIAAIVTIFWLVRDTKTLLPR